MKKNILFVMNNLNCGGAEKALVSLLQCIDYSKYDVDLFLFKHEGIFMPQIPKEVNLLKEPSNYKYFDMSIKKALLELIKKGKFNVALARILFSKTFKQSLNRAVIEQKGWKYLKKSFDVMDKDYDISIGYLEKNPIYFCVDKVRAKQKIGWIHNDYESLGMDRDIDNIYFKNLNYIFTVSEECLKVLKKVFPQYENKLKLMHNIVPVNMVKNLADEKIEDIKFDKSYINIVSIGRLNYQKGFEMAIEACSILINKGYKIKWFVIGEGEERIILQNLINKFHIEDNFKLIGLRENPYPYIKQADVYVQPSRFEGKSIAIDEAKILCKPIVVTNFSTAKDQIKNNETGLIVEMNKVDLAKGIEQLVKKNNLNNMFAINLKNDQFNNIESELYKFYELINK